MSERDPRSDSRTGDVLAKGARVRAVTVVLYGPFVCRTEEDDPWRSRPNGRMKAVDSSLKQWRKWAAKAEVVKRGDVPAPLCDVYHSVMPE